MQAGCCYLLLLLPLIAEFTPTSAGKT